MKIKILGTAAAEGFPAMFCECDTCKRARAVGGRNLRTRSQALVDDTLLIDFGPDTLSHTLYGGLNLTRVTDLLITHSHCDHLLVSDFENRKDGYCKIYNKKPLNVYATTPSTEKIKELCKRDLKINIDIIFIDCTAILLKGWSISHMGLDTNILQINELKEIGVLNDKTTVVLHHFSHNGGATYDELVPIAAEQGFLVAFDGMIMEV